MQQKQGKYTIQGLNVVDICADFGTPLYVYDAQKIADQIHTLRSAFSGCRVQIKYAAKALSNLAILSLMHKKKCGVDTVSRHEIALALNAGFSPQEIIFTPNCVHFDEIIEAVNLGVAINLDNLSVLDKFAQKYRGTYPCCIRINPHLLAGGHYKISTGHADSKFGMPLAQLSSIVEITNRYNVHVNGLHIHTGSELPSPHIFITMAEILFDVARQFPSLDFLDLGGGFKVSSEQGNADSDLFEMGTKLAKSLQRFCKTYGRDVELWIEPGKFLVSQAGHFFVSVNVVKETSSSVFAGVNSGLNHFVRPMMYDAYHLIINISNPSGAFGHYTVVGNICETDTFGANRELNEIREGDILAIENAGAYGYSMASNFNSRPRPAEVLIEEGEARLIRQHEVFEDIVRGQL